MNIDWWIEWLEATGKTTQLIVIATGKTAQRIVKATGKTTQPSGDCAWEICKLIGDMKCALSFATMTEFCQMVYNNFVYVSIKHLFCAAQ